MTNPKRLAQGFSSQVIKFPKLKSLSETHCQGEFNPQVILFFFLVTFKLTGFLKKINLTFKSVFFKPLAS
ncbi:hypothetical protein [Methylotenera sp.]|uniref:hypothetical protein n=1 Tax=Methylotenera sp. TaxID=2051956 RepID=UPI002488DC18|nr:hypothetical protein [Methylotenera sp.]MDI1362533.1 hypothetical protein [Methylotenera sp.]